MSAEHSADQNPGIEPRPTQELEDRLASLRRASSSLDTVLRDFRTVIERRGESRDETRPPLH